MVFPTESQSVLTSFVMALFLYFNFLVSYFCFPRLDYELLGTGAVFLYYCLPGAWHILSY